MFPPGLLRFCTWLVDSKSIWEKCFFCKSWREHIEGLQKCCSVKSIHIYDPDILLWNVLSWHRCCLWVLPFHWVWDCPTSVPCLTWLWLLFIESAGRLCILSSTSCPHWSCDNSNIVAPAPAAPGIPVEWCQACSQVPSSSSMFPSGLLRFCTWLVDSKSIWEKCFFCKSWREHIEGLQKCCSIKYIQKTIPI